jgi:hypothetical protein
MAGLQGRDWVDTVSKLLIPIAIFGFGLIFSMQKDRSDRAAQQFERDTSYVKLLTSQNEKERIFAIRMIKSLQDKGKFPEQLLSAVQALCDGLPSDPVTQEACGIAQTEKPLVAAAKPTEEKSAPTPAASPAPAGGTVFIQIARDDQRGLAGDLRGKLQAQSFAVQLIQLVPHGTTNSYIRYFSNGDVNEANRVLGVMKEMGINASVQDFTSAGNGKIPAGQLEVWIGDKVAGPPASAAQ